MKVTVVTKSMRDGCRKFIGVFSDHDQANLYCDHVDPKSMDYYADEYELDALVEPEDRRAIR